MNKPYPPNKPHFFPVSKVTVVNLQGSRDTDYNLKDILDNIPEEYRNSATLSMEVSVSWDNAYNYSSIYYEVPNSGEEYKRELEKYERELKKYKKDLEKWEFEQVRREREAKIKQYKELKKELGL